MDKTMSTISDEMLGILQRVNGDTMPEVELSTKELKAANLDNYNGTSARDFWEYAHSIGYMLTINKRTMLGCGITENEYTNLDNTLTVFKRLLSLYIEAQWHDDIKSTKASRTAVYNIRSECYRIYKAIRAMIYVSSPCEHGAIDTLAGSILRYSYANRANKNNGYKFSIIGNIPALNAIVKFISASENDTIHEVGVRLEKKNARKLTDGVRLLTDDKTAPIPETVPAIAAQ